MGGYFRALLEYIWSNHIRIFAIILNVSPLRLISTRWRPKTKTGHEMNLNQFKATGSNPSCKVQTSFTEGDESHNGFYGLSDGKQAT